MAERRRRRFWHVRPWSAATLAASLILSAYFLLPLHHFGPHRPVLSWTVFLVSLGLVALLLLVQVRDVVVGKKGAQPGFVIPLLMMVTVHVFSSGYLALARHPGAMSGLDTRVDALYFTVVTLTTVGYGDIVAVGQSARLVVILQILYSFVFITAGATAFSTRLRDLVGSAGARGRGAERAGEKSPGAGDGPGGSTRE